MVQKMWIHITNSCVFIAHTLYKKKGGKLTPLQFRTILVSQTMEKYGETENYCCGSRPSTADNPLQLVGRHFPSYIPATEKKYCHQTVCCLKKMWCLKRITIWMYQM